MKASDIDLRSMLDFRPMDGKILFGSDRMLMFRQAAFDVLRGLLLERLGVELSHSVLSQFGYRCGQDDYQTLATMFQWETEQDGLAAGPVMHSWEGIVLAKPEALNYNMEEGTLLMRGTWENSYEAENYLKKFGQSTSPICFTLAGYASGWASAFMKGSMLCVEKSCIAAGDSSCSWEIRPTAEWDDSAKAFRDALASTETSIHKNLEMSLDRLSAPVLRVWDGVLAMPIIGTLDERRTATITTLLLEEVVRSSVQFVILDVTGVDKVDEVTASGLMRIVSAVELLGSKCFLSGIRGDVARTVSSLSINLGVLKTFATLRQALRHCMKS